MADVRRCLGLVVVLLVLVPSAATAHSNWVETNPDHRATLSTLPPEATVTFGEEPVRADVALTSPDGKTRTLKPQIVGSVITVRLPSSGPRGTYELSYRVVSEDGHPVSGSATFTVTTGPTPSATTPEGSAATPASTPASTPDQEPARGPLVPIVIGVAIVGVAATVFAARSIRR